MYIKVINNVVVQRQPNKEDGFIKVDDSVICGMILKNGKYIIKPKTAKEVKTEAIINQIDISKQYLADTDFKFYNGYKPKENEDLEAIEKLRDDARDYIRTNKGKL